MKHMKPRSTFLPHVLIALVLGVADVDWLVIFSVILVAHWIDIRSYKNGIVKGADMYREALFEQFSLPSKPPTKE